MACRPLPHHGGRGGRRRTSDVSHGAAVASSGRPTTTGAARQRSQVSAASRPWWQELCGQSVRNSCRLLTQQDVTGGIQTPWPCSASGSWKPRASARKGPCWRPSSFWRWAAVLRWTRPCGATTQRQKLLGRQQGPFRALARSFQDQLAEYGHGVWIPPVASCCVRSLREFLTLCPQSSCHHGREAADTWLR